MSKKTYWELLRDPRWQRMRLEVMQRDSFACRECRATDKTLNVHHTYYAKGRKPWEYELESLRTLCEDCHLQTTNKVAEITRLAGMLPPEMCDTVIGILRHEVAMIGDDPSTTILIENNDQLHGVAVAAGLKGADIYVLGEIAKRGDRLVSADAIVDLRIQAGRRNQKTTEGDGG